MIGYTKVSQYEWNEFQNNVLFHFSDHLKKYYNTNNASPVLTIFMRKYS